MAPIDHIKILPNKWAVMTKIDTIKNTTARAKLLENSDTVFVKNNV